MTTLRVQSALNPQTVCQSYINATIPVSYLSVTFSVLWSNHSEAGIMNWYNQAKSISGNVVADKTGYSFTGGNSAIEYSYGDLDEDNNTSTTGAGAAFEFIYNAADSGSSISLAKYEGWRGENTILKLEQWSNTGVFGITIPGFADFRFPSATSLFNTDAHVIFNNRSDGEMEIYLNGVSAGVAERGRWVVNGDLPGQTNWLGGSPNESLVGDIFGVATHERALTSDEISGLAQAFAVPEPSSLAMLSTGCVGMMFRRRKRA